jgi:hypothetical protein
MRIVGGHINQELCGVSHINQELGEPHNQESCMRSHESEIVGEPHKSGTRVVTQIRNVGEPHKSGIVWEHNESGIVWVAT